jgi:hypothetical protein
MLMLHSFKKIVKGGFFYLRITIEDLQFEENVMIW